MLWNWPGPLTNFYLLNSLKSLFYFTKWKLDNGIKLDYGILLPTTKYYSIIEFILYFLRWYTGDEKISSFAWGGAYAHRSSLDKYFSKISHKQNKSWIFLKQAKITTVAPLRSENSDFLMKFKIVGEVKLGPYTESKTSNTPRIPYTRFPILLTLMTLSRSVGESEVSASV